MTTLVAGKTLVAAKLGMALCGKMAAAGIVALVAVLFYHGCPSAKGADLDDGPRAGPNRITWLYAERLDAIEKRLAVVEQRVGIQPVLGREDPPEGKDTRPRQAVGENYYNPYWPNPYDPNSVRSTVQPITQVVARDPLYGSQWWAGAQAPPAVAYTYPVVQSASSVPQVWGVATGVGGPVGPVRRFFGGMRCGPNGCN